MNWSRIPGTTKRSRFLLLLLSRAILLLALLVLTSCATSHGKRPPCTWEVWGINGELVNEDDGRRLPCKGPGKAECIGMVKEDFLNILYCGGPLQPKAKPTATPAPAAAATRGPAP